MWRSERRADSFCKGREDVLLDLSLEVRFEAGQCGGDGGLDDDTELWTIDGGRAGSTSGGADGARSRA